MLPLGLEIFLVLLALLMHAFFSLAETSVLTVRKSRLREILDDDESDEKLVSKARLLLNFKQHIERFIATVQTGSVLASVLAAVFTALIAYNDFDGFLTWWLGVSERTALAISFTSLVILVTVLDLTVGALVPKSIAIQRSESIAFALAAFLNRLSLIVKPVTALPVLFANALLRPFRDKTSFIESRISEEEFRVMLEEGRRSGVIDQTENELIENIFEFRERTAREVMVPRTNIVGIDIESPRHEVIARIVDEGYTRLPVYQSTIDNILGVIYSKDVLALIEHPDLILLYDIVRPVPFVPETKLISELLRELQHQKLHMAVVIDEFGGTAGIITLEDIIEEIVGEIHDEYDEDAPVIHVDDGGKWVMLSANYSIADANMELEKLFEDYHIPDDEEYESVSGYVNKLFGYIPEVGEERETHGIHVVVVKREPNRVVQVRFEDRREENVVKQQNEVE